MSGADLPEGRRRPRRGRWRVALRYASRDARRHKGRTALVAIMVALPAGLGSASAVLLSSTWDDSPATAVASALGTDSRVQAEVMLATPVAVTQGIDGLGGYGPPDDDATLPAALFTGPVPDGGDWSTYPRLDGHRYEAALADALPAGDTLVRVASLDGITLRGARPGLHATTDGYQLDTSSPARSAYGIPDTLGAGEVALGRDVAHDVHLRVVTR